MSTVKAAKPKPTTHPVLGKLPAGWKAVRLGEIGELRFSGVDKKSEEGEVPVLLCNYMDVYNNRRITPGMDFMRATATPNEIERFTLRQGDVLFTKDSEKADDMANAAVVKEDMEGVVCGYHLALVRPDPMKCDGEYLMLQFLNPLVRHQFTKRANGITRFSMTLDTAAGIVIPLPPLAEQRRIARILGTWDKAIALLGQQIAAKEERLRGLIDQLVSGQRHGAKEGKLPKGWRWVELGEAVVKQSAKYDPTQGEESLPVIELENIESGSGRIIGDLRANGQLSMKNRFKAGQVLFGKLRPYLRKYVRPAFDGACSSEVWVLDGKRGVCDNGFLLSLVQSQRFVGRCLQTTGSKMPRADWEHLSSYAFAFPTIDEQVRIAAIISTLRKEHEVLLGKLEQLQEQKRGLMQGLLGGWDVQQTMKP